MHVRLLTLYTHSCFFVFLLILFANLTSSSVNLLSFLYKLVYWASLQLDTCHPTRVLATTKNTQLVLRHIHFDLTRNYCFLPHNYSSMIISLLFDLGEGNYYSTLLKLIDLISNSLTV